MTQSMSRVAKCIDNGPIEGFWGPMRREMYYGKKYKTKEELIAAIKEYIDYYTNKRVQRNLGVLTPMEYHSLKLQSLHKETRYMDVPGKKCFSYLIVYLTGSAPYIRFCNVYG